ncbi:TonB-dependent receptor [Flaviaesturariibacter amylovorans]|uniref:TonB-dependent receptor n=1 Tax=Flaviaesturariibacter amylovorans TaxID=1084520 RepID=A0ABP8GZX4_9BACT
MLVILIALVHLSVSGNAQKVSFAGTSVPLKQVFPVIEQQTGYVFFYDAALLREANPVTVRLTDAPLEDALKAIFRDQPLNWLIENRTITVHRKADAQVGTGNRNAAASAAEARRPVRGKVTDEGGQPLEGVSVVLKGTRRGVATNAAGEFLIELPEQGAGTLVFSFIGRETREVGTGDQTYLQVVLQSVADKGQEVVVIGYGSQRKIDVTAPVAVVRGAEIAKQPSINPASGLQGKVAGVHIINDGSPGASPQIRIRGVGSVNGGLAPLYVVDGVWTSDIGFLNSADIETISVLKDASAAAIYGNRSANGVVIITTIKGRAGTPMISYTGSAGWQKITNKVQMANAQQYATMANEVSMLNGGTPVYGPAAMYNPGTSNPEGTDWFGQLFRHAFITNHQLSFRGGSENSTYNYSLSYVDQQGIVETQNYKRFTARLQNEFRAASFLKVGYNMFGTINRSRDINGDIFRQAYAAPPVVPVRYKDGFYGDPLDYSLNSIANPQVTLDFHNQRTQQYLIVGNTYADIKLPLNLTFRSMFTFEYNKGEQRNYVPVYNATTNQRNDISSLNVTRSEVKNWQLENTLSFEKTISRRHHLRIMAAQSARSDRSYFISGSAKNVPHNYDGQLYLSLGANSSAFPNVATDGGALATGASYFGRVNYAFDGKYLLNLTYRADGSSKYAGEHRWGFFPSVGAAWVISRERFLEGSRLINSLKLRGSWGVNGNVNVPANLTTLTASSLGYAVWAGAAAPSRSIISVVPPSLFWEKGVSADIGLEASLFRSRLTVEADVYTRDTKDAIFTVPILASSGLGGGINANQATIRNRGVELSLGWRDRIGKHIQYSVSGNYAYNQNEILSVNSGANALFGGYYSNPSQIPLTRTVVGRPIGMFYGYEVEGVFQTIGEVQRSPQSRSAMVGDLRFRDQNGDGAIDDQDKVEMGNPNPKHLFGLNLGFSYKHLDLSVDLQGVAGVDVYNANMGRRFGLENFTEEFYANHWRGPGTSNTHPSANLLHGMNTHPNTFWVEDGSYIRVRNINAGYNFRSLSNWKISSLRVFAAIQNPFNFFRYKGFSPEVTAAGNSPVNAGIDAGVYPLSAYYNFGVTLTL